MERYKPFLIEKMKKQRDKDTEIGWIHGAYILHAIGAVLSKNGKYPETPMQFYAEENYDQGDDETHAFTDADRFMAFAITFNAEHQELNKPKETDAEPDIERHERLAEVVGANEHEY